MKFQFKNIASGNTFDYKCFESAKKAAEDLKNEGRLNDFLINIYDDFHVYEENQLLTDIFKL
jgi:hypothetical protein